MKTQLVLYVGNTNVVEHNVFDMLRGEPANDVVVEGTLNDAAGGPVAGVSWPIQFGYLPNSRGRYVAVLPDTLAITAEQPYTMLIVAEDTFGNVMRKTKTMIARVRRC